MRIIRAADDESYRRMTTEELRRRFLLGDLFQPGRIELVYTDADRAIIGGITPAAAPLRLEGGREMACEYFFQRREAGIINLGAPGTVTVDGNLFRLARRE